MSRTSKTRKKTTRKAPSLEVEVFRFILSRISNKDWGRDKRTRHDRFKPVPHANTAARIRDALNREPLRSGKTAFVPSISHKLLWQHQVGTVTLCLTGNGDPRDPESLFLIDVDCKDRPNPAQARQFLEDLKADPNVPSFADLFVEPSSSGNAAHGHGGLVKTPGQPDKEVNSDLGLLQEYVRRRLVEGKKQGRYGDITDVEIKGTCMVVEWKNGRAEEVRCGQLAKVPVTALDRPLEFLGLSRIPASVLRSLHRVPIEFPVEQPPEETVDVTCEGTSKRRGSTRNHPVPGEVVERIGSAYSLVAHKYVPEPLRTSGRHVATAEDVAIYLAIAGYLTSRQGEDRAMPSRRIGAIWKAMYEAGEVERPHCVKRVAAIRNHLSDLGLIAWQDEQFWCHDKPGSPEGDGRKGVCCKYSLSPVLMEELGFEERGGESKGTRESTAGTGVEIISFTPSSNPSTRRYTPPDPQIQALLGFDAPVIRPIRVGWASEYWGREAA